MWRERERLKKPIKNRNTLCSSYVCVCLCVRLVGRSLHYENATDWLRHFPVCSSVLWPGLPRQPAPSPEDLPVGRAERGVVQALGPGDAGGRRREPGGQRRQAEADGDLQQRLLPAGSLRLPVAHGRHGTSSATPSPRHNLTSALLVEVSSPGWGRNVFAMPSSLTPLVCVDFFFFLSVYMCGEAVQ